MIPFYVKGEAVGTIWVVSHDDSCRFDAEDLRVMTNLGIFAAAAYQTVLSLNAGQRMVSIIEGSDDAIVSKDLNGIITSWNRGAERIFGYLSEEMIGKPVAMLIPAELQSEEPAILGRIRRGESIEHYQTVRIRKHGGRIDVSLSVSPLRDASGKIVGASKIARDITEQKRSEAQIAILAREAEHRAKNLLPCRQRCTWHKPTRRTVSNMQSKGAFKPLQMFTSFLRNRVGRGRNWIPWLSKSLHLTVKTRTSASWLPVQN